MRTSVKKRTDKAYLLFFITVAFYIIYILINSLKLPVVDLQVLEKFNTIFISILLQAFPFVLIGTLVSSVLNELVSEEFIARVFPKRKIPSYIAAIVFGLLFPICDCAVVPIAGRLVKKGIPTSSAIIFMLSAPIVNPIVIASTLYAFPDNPFVAVLRVSLGIIIAVTVGESISSLKVGTTPLFSTIRTGCSCGYNHGSKQKYHYNEQHIHNVHCHNHKASCLNLNRIISIFNHMGEEFFIVGKYLVIGAFVSGAFQSATAMGLLSNFNLSDYQELLVMMACGFVLSICSTSDAFIARSFLNQFSLTSVMGFMVVGPMIDIKNTLMLTGSFSKKFVAKLITIIFIEAFVIIFFVTSIITYGGL